MHIFLLAKMNGQHQSYPLHVKTAPLVKTPVSVSHAFLMEIIKGMITLSIQIQ